MELRRVTLFSEPGPHLVAADALPGGGQYDDLLRAIPKPAAFEWMDKFKSDLKVGDSDNET